MQDIISKSRKKYTVVDLFSGCGGFSEGFKKAGFEIVAANEYWEGAQKTYAKNHKRTKLVKGDITKKETKKELFEAVKNTKINLVIGGPPCQAFSMAGKRDPNDPRAKLYLDYLEIIKEINPDCFVMENVKGLLSAKNQDGNLVLEEIKKSFKDLDYDFIQEVFNSKEYNVPQKRERVMIIGFKKDFNLDSIPRPKKIKKIKTVFEAIDDLKDKKENEVPNHTFSKHSENFIEKIKKTKIGKSIYDTYCDAYHRCPPQEPARTVKENHGSVFVHYEKNRVMTPRELARLQSFDDKFIFEGSKGQILTQIGNAVPPKLSFAIAKEIKKTLDFLDLD